MLAYCAMLAALSLGQVEQTYKVGDKVVALREAEITHEGRVVGTAEPGYPMRVAGVEAGRLRVSAGEPGWIPRDDVLPLALAPKFFSEAIVAEPANADLYRARGRAWYALDNYAAAIVDFSEDASLRPSNDALVLRGSAWFAAGDVDRALADFDRADMIDPLDPPGRALRALAWSTKGEQAKALAEANAAVEAAPQMAYGYRIRAEIQLSCGAFRQTIADCGRALRHDPSNLDALRMRAYAYHCLGKQSRALRGYCEVLNLDPADWQALSRRGFILGRTGEYERALADLNHAAQLRPLDASILLSRASVHQADGNALAAAADYLAILRLDARALSQWNQYRISPQLLDTQETDEPAPRAAPRGAYMLDGFCPVTLVEEKRWQPGAADLTAAHDGCNYRFTTRENREKFLADPQRYHPLAGGWDLVILVNEGRYVAGERSHGVFCWRQILLFNSERTLEKFSRDSDLYIRAIYGPGYKLD